MSKISKGVQSFPDLPREGFRDPERLLVDSQRGDQVLDPRPTLKAVAVAQHADGLDPADLDPLELLRDHDLLDGGRRRAPVVPDLDLDATVQGSARLGLVRGEGSGVSGPLERDRLGRQLECRLDELGDLAGALPGKPPVVAVDPREVLRERLRVGVSDEVRTQVFDPFFTTKESGSGLGLSIAYSVVQGHGGNIALESEPGAGSGFVMTLPT